MSVQQMPSSKAVPIADYRNLQAWRESNRYKEIKEAGNESERISKTRQTPARFS